MVFLIQNTQNWDTDEAQLDRIRANYAELAQKARRDLQHGRGDTKVPAFVES